VDGRTDKVPSGAKGRIWREMKKKNRRREGRKPYRVQWCHEKGRVSALKGASNGLVGELHMKELTKEAYYFLKRW
jgi:hypothetical protein